MDNDYLPCTFVCFLFSRFTFGNNCCWLCGRERTLMILSGFKEPSRCRGQQGEQLIYFCAASECIWEIMWGLLLSNIYFSRFFTSARSAYCMPPVILLVCAYLMPLMCVPVRACACVLFYGLAGEWCKRMIRLGADQRCSAITQGLWGIWSYAAFQGCFQLGSSLPRFPHTYQFNCLCFFHYFYCLFSALLAPRACGKVIVMAAVCLQPPSLRLAENGWCADAWGRNLQITLCAYISLNKLI